MKTPQMYAKFPNSNAKKRKTFVCFLVLTLK